MKVTLSEKNHSLITGREGEEKKDAEEERCYANIRVLAQLTQNDKLCTTSDALFTIHVPTTWRAVAAPTTADDARKTSSTCVRRCARHPTPNGPSRGAGAEQPTADEPRGVAAPAHGQTDAAKDGVANLLQTYRRDAALTSQITLILAD